jgi:N-dimethylarginine dimethylaminohydrolase
VSNGLIVTTDNQETKLYSKAIVRRPGRNFAKGITTSNLGKPDFEKALEQHVAYYDALERCGVELIVLKSDIAYLGKGNFISTPAFLKMVYPANTIILDQDESYSANCLLVNDFLLIPKGFPKSKKKIADLEYNIIELKLSEFRKMDGGLTCLSLLF